MTVEFGKLLLHYRNELNISQRELERRTGICNSDISRFETGTREPNPAYSVDLMNTLEVPDAEKPSFLLHAAGHSTETIEHILTVEPAMVKIVEKVANTPLHTFTYKWKTNS